MSIIAAGAALTGIGVLIALWAMWVVALAEGLFDDVKGDDE
jgi:hypothetical protein